MTTTHELTGRRAAARAAARLAGRCPPMRDPGHDLSSHRLRRPPLGTTDLQYSGPDVVPLSCVVSLLIHDSHVYVRLRKAVLAPAIVLRNS